MTPQTLRQAIDQRSLTVTGAARLLGISRNYLHAMLSGRRRIPEERADSMRCLLAEHDERKEQYGGDDV